MARPFFKNYDPADANADGYVDDTTADDAIALLASGPGDGLAHQINITASGDISGVTFTITGTDEYGHALTEAIAGPNGAGTVETTGYFKTVSSITKSDTMGAETADIGWVDEFATPAYPMNRHSGNASLTVTVTGTINYTLQQTMSDLTKPESEWIWTNSTDTDLVSATTSQISVFAHPVSAIRLLANSYSSGAELDLEVVQALP